MFCQLSTIIKGREGSDQESASDGKIALVHAIVYIVCHDYIDTCIYLFVVHLDIILLVVSDGDDSTKGWKSLFENPGVIEVHELQES